MIQRIANTTAWICALAAVATAVCCLWLTRYQPIEMDLAMLHYSAFLINEKHLLLYRDIFENNLPGPFFFHALIGKLFGYGAQPIRFLDAGIIVLLALCSWKILSPISKQAALFAPTFYAFIYIASGPVSAFQRDYIATLPLAAALAWLCNTRAKPVRDALLVGTACGIACAFKPNFLVMAIGLFWILLSKLNGHFFTRVKVTIIPVSAGFIAAFSIPLLWGLQHADFTELTTLYKTYTPIYVSTRTDLFHYSSKKEQILALINMQGSHLLKMGLLSIPGLLWAWRQNLGHSENLTRLRYLAIATFCISWHEIIAGKYWFAHLLAPYFFAILCFSLLLTPVITQRGKIERSVSFLFAAALLALTIKLGGFAIHLIQDKHYTADNYDIRSQKIARYLLKNMSQDDKVQSLDGSGDGQGALLLAKATTATRFVEDIPLYLQPDAPITQQFRREFLDDMRKSPPAFFVYIHNFFHPAGGNRLKEFKELYQFLTDNYDIGEEEDGQYTIYRYRKKDR